MKNLAAMETDWDPQSYRELIAAVINLAVEDLQLPEGSAHRISAHRFIFGDWSEQCDRYLVAIDMNPERFRAALKAKLVDMETV